LIAIIASHTTFSIADLGNIFRFLNSSEGETIKSATNHFEMFITRGVFVFLYFTNYTHREARFVDGGGGGGEI
jgi:hypothetical protein